MIEMVLSTLIFILSFIFVLSLLVFIHEMGHYSVARLFKVTVERFSIGFGKPLLRWTAKSGTLWTVGRIPLGGYVKFLGDAGAASNPDTEQLEKIKAEMNEKHGKDSWKSCFHFKPLYQRTLVVLAGPMANFILAAVIYMGFAMFWGISSRTAVVGAVSPGTVAEQAGFQVGDEILSINDDKIDNWRGVLQYVTLRSGEPLKVIVERDLAPVELNVTPQRTTKTDMVGGKLKVVRSGLFGAEPILMINTGSGRLQDSGSKRLSIRFRRHSYISVAFFKAKKTVKHSAVL